MIVVRLSDQRRQNVEQTLARFLHEKAHDVHLETSLVILGEEGMRIRSSV